MSTPDCSREHGRLDRPHESGAFPTCINTSVIGQGPESTADACGNSSRWGRGTTGGGKVGIFFSFHTSRQFSPTWPFPVITNEEMLLSPQHPFVHHGPSQSHEGERKTRRGEMQTMSTTCLVSPSPTALPLPQVARPPSLIDPKCCLPQISPKQSKSVEWRC